MARACAAQARGDAYDSTSAALCESLCRAQQRQQPASPSAEADLARRLSAGPLRLIQHALGPSASPSAADGGGSAAMPAQRALIRAVGGALQTLGSIAKQVAQRPRRVAWDW